MLADRIDVLVARQQNNQEEDMVYDEHGNIDEAATREARLRHRLRRNTRGYYDAEGYLDWEMTVEQKFSAHLVPEQHREPAKSSSSVASTGRTTGIQCHRCHGFGHVRKDCPSQRAYIATEDGYISASDIEDDEEEEAKEAVEGGDVLGNENTIAFRSIIVKRVLSVQAQQPEKLQRHNLFQIFFVINNR
ncbi:hypothetical protein PVAP13_1NG202019 [Panicum virgatum]|uniref:CCHC-type domain-containing protein n=1 Tax=Panicum virgatum TaxID=38727 RepID=A0A8T0WZY9_PANVG|nr:hypothetical protein PVAP13_1NG202019 [Panicum virgatum]